MNRFKLIAGIVALVVAFAAGFKVATWRAQAQTAHEIAVREAAYRTSVEQMVKGITEDNDATRHKESELAAELRSSNEKAEEIQHEIASRPVLKQIVRVPVGGECAPVPSVDWSVFADLYNRAAAGGPTSGAADALDGSLLRDAAGRPR